MTDGFKNALLCCPSRWECAFVLRFERDRAAAKCLLAFATTLLCTGAVLAQTTQVPTAGQLAARVDRHYDRLRSLEARYTERYRGMGIDRTETGTLLLRKPGRMRWSYDAPAGKVFVLDGRDAISYTPGDAQANRLPARQLNDLQSPLRFLLGHTALSRELDNLSLALADGGYTLSGVPRGMAGRIRSVFFTLDGEGIIHGLQIDETNGSITSFAFTDMHENVPAPDSNFVFTPPPGVTVVNASAPL